MLTRPRGSQACFSASFPEPLAPKGLRGQTAAPGCRVGPRPPASSGLAAPRPSPPGRAQLRRRPPPRCPLGLRPGSAGVDTGGGRRAGCCSPCGAARVAAFVCKHPARRALPVSAAPPLGAGRAGRAGVAGRREGPHEMQATRPLSGPARP